MRILPALLATLAGAAHAHAQHGYSGHETHAQYLAGAGMGYAKAAALEGEYRLSHLETHRRMRALLTLEQVDRCYDALRGCSSPQAVHKHRH